MGRIVVGVDGSPESIHALRSAAEEARLRGSPLVVVHAYRFDAPGPQTHHEGVMPVTFEHREHLENEAKKAAEETLEAALSDLEREVGDIQVERQVLQGRPAEVLVNQSGEADFVFLGSRGLGGFAGE